MAKKLVTRSGFATLAGVSPAAITRACEKALSAAVVGEKIDAGHQVALQYIEKQKKPKTKPKRTRRPAPMPVMMDENGSDPEPIEVPEAAEHVAEYLDMTLREILERFGTSTRFLEILKAIQTLESIQEKQIKNAVATGELVRRDLIRKGIIEPLDSTVKKLLTDGVRTISKRVTTMHAAGRGIEEIEALVSDQIASFVKPMKAKMIRALRNASA